MGRWNKKKQKITRGQDASKCSEVLDTMNEQKNGRYAEKKVLLSNAWRQERCPAKNLQKCARPREGFPNGTAKLRHFYAFDCPNSIAKHTHFCGWVPSITPIPRVGALRYGKLVHI